MILGRPPIALVLPVAMINFGTPAWQLSNKYTLIADGARKAAMSVPNPQQNSQLVMKKTISGVAKGSSSTLLKPLR
jgi:hypothetical protein